MKIVHICIGSAYTEGLTYQENILADIHTHDGHDVLIVSDCHQYNQGQIITLPPEDRRLLNGARLVRLSYTWVFFKWLTEKIRKVSGLKSLLEEFKPDVILFHGVAGWELRTVGAYKRNYPITKLYLDCHEDCHNSGQNFISRIFQYKILTKWLLLSILPQVEKILYISEESREFLVKMYKVSDEFMEFYPLGGLVIDPIVKAENRRKIRKRLGIGDEQLVYVHTGKLDAGKQTLEILKAFSNLSDPKAKFLIAGYIPEDQVDILSKAIKSDARVKFLGWQSKNDFIEILCASDVYVQPGTQSASLQIAICCGLPIMVHPYISHKTYVNGNGCFIKSSQDMQEWFEVFSKNPKLLKKMSNASYALAKKLLDYNKLAARIYQ